MRMCLLPLSLSIIPLFTAYGLPAQTKPLKVCVSQDGKGYDALRLALELSSRKLQSGASLAVVAITEKALSAEQEQQLIAHGVPYVRVVTTERSAKGRSTEVERLGCDFTVRVVYHDSVDIYDVPNLGVPSLVQAMPGPQSNEDRASVGYELKKAGSKKVVARASAPPRTVYVRQGHRVFDPYKLFANQIVKKLNIANSQPHQP